jgi:biotin carboxyl carrier protein
MKREINLNCPWLITEEKPVKFIRWLVSEEDHIEMDQDIMVILLNDEEYVVPSPVDGTIQTIMAEPGDIIDPDQALAVILID